MILSVFPILAVFAAFAGLACAGTGRENRRGGSRAGGLAAFTAVYHVGYSDFRCEKVRKPLTGDVVWSAPTLVTLSPFGAPITHAGLHVTAVVHSYDTETFLPPHGRPRPTRAPICSGTWMRS